MEIAQICFVFYHQWNVLQNENIVIDEKQFYKTYWIEDSFVRGRNCKYRKVTRKSDKKVWGLKMVKKAGKSLQDIKAIKTAAMVKSLCNHENIVSSPHYCETKKRFYCVQEFLEWKILGHILANKYCNERLISDIIRKLASGLAHLHSFGFAHGNLNPDNIMYATKNKNEEIKIVGFDYAVNCNFEDCSASGGIANYMAPEVIDSKIYKTSADMWSLGMILYILLCGFPPFHDEWSKNTDHLYSLIREAKVSFPAPYWDDISESAKDLVQRLLVKESDERLTAYQVLNHPYIVKKECDDIDRESESFKDEYFEQLEHWNSSHSFIEHELSQEMIVYESKISLFYQSN